MTSPPIPTPRPPVRPGRGADKARLAEILRVDHAGELGAVAIYQGQRAVFAALDRPPPLAAAVEEMAKHEAEHLAIFDGLLTERRARPTLLAPFWRLAGFALGAGTALMGERAAHACTEAVEIVIERHYAEQIAEIGAREPQLARTLSSCRDDELSHRDLAVQGGAREAPGYALLSAAIGAGCRAAIRLAEKI